MDVDAAPYRTDTIPLRNHKHLLPPSISRPLRQLHSRNPKLSLAVRPSLDFAALSSSGAPPSPTHRKKPQRPISNQWISRFIPTWRATLLIGAPTSTLTARLAHSLADWTIFRTIRRLRFADFFLLADPRATRGEKAQIYVTTLRQQLHWIHFPSFRITTKPGRRIIRSFLTSLAIILSDGPQMRCPVSGI